MRKRDFLKREAEQSRDQSCWAAYRAARNEVNNLIKATKRKYFETNLVNKSKYPHKTWQLINELSFRQHIKRGIAEIVIGESKINSAPEMAEAFNHHFANVGHDLAKGISRGVIEPEYYLKPTISSCSISEVLKFLENLEVMKATQGLDNMPARLFKSHCLRKPGRGERWGSADFLQTFTI